MLGKTHRFWLMTLMAASTTCHAGLPEIPPAPTAQAVSELLLLDAQQALAIERAKPRLSTDHASSLASQAPQHASQALPTIQPKAPAPALTFIQGVGPRLRARVIIDGQALTFASGRAQAMGGPNSPWRLKRIAPPCIDLENIDHGAMRLCAAHAEAAP